MNYELSKLFGSVGSRESASESDIERVEKHFGVSLPEDYLEFLRFSNGIEGILKGGTYVSIWPIEEVVDDNTDYEVNELAPGIILFGSNGGGTAFGFDFRDKSAAIVEVPFIGMDLDEVRYRARNFIEFISSL